MVFKVTSLLWLSLGVVVANDPVTIAKQIKTMNNPANLIFTNFTSENYF